MNEGTAGGDYGRRQWRGLSALARLKSGCAGWAGLGYWKQGSAPAGARVGSGW